MGVWQRVGIVAIGGLTDVGFADDHFLLVIGHQGRGLLDCHTAERVARDRLDDWSFFDEQASTAVGIGPVAGHAIPVAGLMSQRTLPRRAGGWSVVERTGGLHLESDDGTLQDIDESEEIRVFGFSAGGGTLVVGTSSDIAIYRRTGGL